MKAHIPASARLTRRQKQIVREYDSSIVNENFQRFVKLSIVSLHEKFGFGMTDARTFSERFPNLRKKRKKTKSSGSTAMML